MFSDPSSTIITVTTWIVPLLLSITLHEAAHGYAALLFGDDTAKRAGRLTLNPINHVDPFGTVMLPGLLMLIGAPFLFGYAKPVPVNFFALKNPKRDMVWVAAAGPGTNIALAFLSALLLHILPLLSGNVANWVLMNLQNSIAINLVLAVFNMIPLPPLDGGRVAVGLLPAPLARPLAALEPKGMLILIGLIFILPLLGGMAGLNLSIFEWLVLPIVEWLYSLVMTLAGWGA